MFRQFQMIQWPEMPKVMAPCHGTMGQDNVYHFLKSCMILFKKYNILSINMGKQEDQIFLYIPTELDNHIFGAVTRIKFNRVISKVS